MMDLNAQFIAGAIAGFVSPFVQEILFGAKLSGRLAAAVSIAITFVIAAVAFWLTGGFATAKAAPAFDWLNPSASVEFWWKLWLPVYGIAQGLYSLTTRHEPEGRSIGPIQTVAEKVNEAVAPTPKPSES